MILLGLEVYKAEITKAVIVEFLRRGLDKVYSKEIEEWQKYMREQKFSVKLDKQMREEIDRFTEEIKLYTVPELKEFIISVI